jgi:hypothetical protein
MHVLGVVLCQLLCQLGALQVVAVRVLLHALMSWRVEVQPVVAAAGHL